MEVPPGLSYLVRILPLPLLPCAATHAVLTYILPLLTSGALPPWSRVAAALLAQPAGVFLSDLYEKHRQAGDAAASGAVRMPVIHDKWPLGLSVLSALKESVRSGYPGDLIRDWSEEHGNTFIMKVLLQKVTPKRNCSRVHRLEKHQKRRSTAPLSLTTRILNGL
ncbi:hypothetical protein GGX14DRAFT_562515 [Mycena pura]|uniref:Uncharacterized protein n=1 Tax=Mycena pura TaxID=153505 RepID=A0AAD6YE08_9AGAR|nr:hypothetical protein GGX14DRAFT_562515 [Mycena pura]